MNKPLCLVTAPVETRSGYGAHSRDICRSLIKLDKYDVHIMGVRWGNCPMNALNEDDPNDKMIIDRLLKTPQLSRQPDLHIHIVIPNEFHTLGKYNIGITAGLEMTICPPTWLEGMNRMDLNIVPSTFVKHTMEGLNFDITDKDTKQKKGELKVHKPVEVLFEGTDTNIFKKTKEFSKELVDEMKNIEEPFNFLYVGHWLQGNLGKDRKDTGMMLKVFLESFKNQKNKPGLIMKTSGAGFSILDRQEMLNKIESIKKTVNGDLPNVYLLHGDFTDEEMNELYNHPKVKAHVNLTHGEGFGRPLLEASISEKPIIASDWSGHKDFLSKDLAIMLKGGMSNVEKGSVPDEFLIDGSQWFTVNYRDASLAMKGVYKSYKKYTINAKKLAIVNRSKFSLKAMTTKFGKMLDKYVPEFAQEVKLELPKLKKVGSTEPPKISLPKLKKVGSTEPPKISLPKLKRV
jgi:glycosyltransferase involved in cell wall biosynthesis|tara:strand:- start:693 stop:2069 length:1377 start_codon:yes stop_codon:yes gene_type:complete